MWCMKEVGAQVTAPFDEKGGTTTLRVTVRQSRFRSLTYVDISFLRLSVSGWSHLPDRRSLAPTKME